MSSITLTVNGQPHTVDVDPATPLLYVLSDDLQLRGPKFSCGLSQCGACTAIVGGNAVRTCVMPVSRASGAEITTLDGLGTPEKSVNWAPVCSRRNYSSSPKNCRCRWTGFG